MQKIAERYKQVPTPDDFAKLKWYVIFIGTVRNIVGVHQVCNDLGIPAHRIWAPVYQEHCRTQSDIVLTDRLIYPGYMFIGLETSEVASKLTSVLRDEAKGFLLGGHFSFLTVEELQYIEAAATMMAEAPKIMFDVKEGDSVIISSGFLSGFRATVTKIMAEGVVYLNVFFMNRELQVEMSVLDIQSLGGPIGDIDQ